MAELPVDQAEAWAIACGSFINIFFTFGTLAVTGVIFVEALVYYDSRSTTGSLMISMAMAGRLLTVAVYPILVRYLSNRTSAVFGCFLLSLGATSFLFTHNITAFGLFFGICTGVGRSLLLYSTVGHMGYYFQKRLKMAHTFVFMGGCIGSLVLPQFVEYTTSEYGFSGAMLIIGALLMQPFIGASLLRPIAFYANIQSKLTPKDNNSQQHMQQHISKADIAHATVKLTGYIATEPSAIIGDCGSHHIAAKSDQIDFRNTGEEVFTVSQAFTNQTLNQPENVPRNTVSALGSGSHSKEASEANRQRTSHDTVCQNTRLLLSSVEFRLISIGRLLSVTGLYSFILFIPPYLKSIGFSSRQTALLLTICGSGDIVGRIIHGWLATHIPLKTTTYFGIAIVLGSVVVFVSTLLPTHSLTMIIVPVTVVLYGVVPSFGSLLIMECTGPKLYPDDVPLTEIPAGVALTVLPLVYGYMFDVWASYTAQICISACFCLVGGLVILPAGMTGTSIDISIDIDFNYKPVFSTSAQYYILLVGRNIYHYIINVSNAQMKHQVCCE